MEKDYDRLREFLGGDKANKIIYSIKEQEVLEKKPAIKRGFVR
ncbi:MAG: hypothetical protein ABSA18_09450 [Dehalococcoidia bacterium]|jgi:hypothetical protein